MITNLAAGLQGPLSHVEVFEEAKKAGPRLAALIKEIVLKIDSTWPNNVKIRDEVINDVAFESFPFWLENVQKLNLNREEIKEWVKPAGDFWDMSNLGENPVSDVYWFMAKGAAHNVAS